eukprot:scaffold5.g605.t1
MPRDKPLSSQPPPHAITVMTPKAKKVRFTKDLASRDGPVSVTEGVRLDVSAAEAGDEHELWLLQLPLDFDPKRRVEWEILPDRGEGQFHGRCKVDGAEFLLMPDPDAGPGRVFASPAGPAARFVPVARRLTVLRATLAPALCFGVDQHPHQHQLSPRDAAPLAATAKQLERPVAAPVAAPARKAQPARSGAAPAAPTATGTAVPGAEGSKQQSMPVAAEAPAADERGGKPSEKKKKKKKRSHEEEGGGSKEAKAAAAAEGSAEKKHKKEKKDKKKEKKDKRKDKA